MKYAVARQFFDRYIRQSSYEKLEKKCDFGIPSHNSTHSAENTILTVDGDIATITIRGILLEERDPVYDWIGIPQTTYLQITEATEKAATIPGVSVVNYDAQGPGGTVAGLENACSIIRNCELTTIFSVSNECCSALYWLACSADKIHAIGDSTLIGSIGIVVDTVDYSGWEDSVGIKDISITNRLSPDKRVDLSTEHGVSVLEDELDELYVVMESAIADGRSQNSDFSIDNVRSIKGRVVTSQKALSLGLIDAITNYNEVPTINTEESSMATLTEFLEENPEEKKKYDEALDVARQEGRDESSGDDSTQAVNDERARIATLIDLQPTAISENLKCAIADGSNAGAFAVTIVKSATATPQTETPAAAPTASAQNTSIIPSVPSAITPEELTSADAKAESEFNKRVALNAKKARR